MNNLFIPKSRINRNLNTCFTRNSFYCLFFILISQFAFTNTQSSETVENTMNVELRADIRLFTVMAALNAAGFDYENPNQEMSQVRQNLRADLKQLDTTIFEPLQTFYRNHQGRVSPADTPIPYVSLALLLSSPPDFQLSSRETFPDDVLQVRGFELLVKDFYHKADIASLWQRYRIDHENELQRYQPIVKEIIEQSLKYFRVPLRVSLDRKMILMPDLLNAKNIVNARNLERTYYLAVGPTDNPLGYYPQIQHECLHLLVDPLVRKYDVPILKHKSNILRLVQNRDQWKPEYSKNFLLMVTESIIEGIALRLRKPENMEQKITGLFQQGLILLPYVHRRLQQYEENRLLSFPAYLEIFFQNPNLSKIKDDVARFSAPDQQAVTIRKEKSIAQEESARVEAQKRHINTLLNDASLLISEKKYVLAQQKLEALLKEDPNHGSAFFYLAQIASQTQKHDQALNFYTRASRATKIPDWARAWSLLRSGRILAAEGNFSQATIKFREVLTIQGELKGAKKQAQDALKRLPNGNNP